MAQPGRRRREEEPHPIPNEELTATDEGAAKEPEPMTAPTRKSVTLVLTGAGSYTVPGSPLGTVRKGQPFDVDEGTAKELLGTGFFKEA